MPYFPARRLIKHSIYNLLGLGLPLIVAMFTIPILIRELGDARFGLLTLIWAIVSYFGLFDLGLGRVLTQQLAVIFATNENNKVGPLVATASTLMVILGIVAGILMSVTAYWVVNFIRDVPDQRELIEAIYAMAVAMPFIVLTSGFRGILEARHMFGLVNMIRLPMGLFTFVGPLLVVLYDGPPRINHIAWILVAGRVIACVVHALYAWRALLVSRGELTWQTSLVKPLCISGGWLTVSNIISPFMGYVDRFVIGTLVSASAVTYYATPHEMVTKLWILPGALTAVLFPAFAGQITEGGDPAWLLFKKAVRWLFLTMLPVTVVLSMFSHELLTLWINAEFADHSAAFVQIFAAGILINCIAHVPFTLMQSANASRLPALAHLIELPLYAGTLWWLTLTHGAFGAALAWLLRIAVDTLLMFLLCVPLLGKSVKNLMSVWVLILTLLAAGGFVGILFQPMALRVSWGFFILSAAVLMQIFLAHGFHLRHLTSIAPRLDREKSRVL